jgi:hypothetical protein
LIGVVVAVISSNATIGSDLGRSTVGTEWRLGSHRSYVRAKNDAHPSVATILRMQASLEENDVIFRQTPLS